MSVGSRADRALRLRCWELASADTKGSAQSTSTRARTPRERSKLLQRSRIAQPSDKTLDAAQKALDSLSGTFIAPQAANALETERYKKLEDWDLGPTSPAEHSTRGILLPPGEKDRFYGSMSGTQVEAELKRLAILVKGLLRDLTIVKDSVWHLEDERHEVHEKLTHVENAFGFGEAKTNEHVLRLTGQVEMLEARVAVSDDSQAQIAELAGQVELLDARLTACEDIDSWRSTKRPGTGEVLQNAANCGNLLLDPMDIAEAQEAPVEQRPDLAAELASEVSAELIVNAEGLREPVECGREAAVVRLNMVSPVRPASEPTEKSSVVKAVRAATYRVAAESYAAATLPPQLPISSSRSEAVGDEDVESTGPRWGRPSLPENNWPEGRVPPGQSMKMMGAGAAASDDSSPSSSANVGAEAAADFGMLPAVGLAASTAAPAPHSGPSQEAAASGCSPVPEDSSVHEGTPPPKMRAGSAASTASGPTPQPSEPCSSTGKSQQL